MPKYLLPIVIEKDKDGYFAVCPVLRGCYSQGDTTEEAMKNVEDAIRLHVADRLAAGEPVPTADGVSLSTIEIRV